MFGPQRGSIEREHAAALENPVDNRVRQVFVVEHAPPGGERFVGGEDHRAFLPMAIVDDVEEHVGGIGAIREMAHFVDDQRTRMKVGGQRLGEPATAECGGEFIDQLGGGDEARVEAVLDRAIRNRHGEMRFPAPGFPPENHAAPFGDEIRRERRPEERESDRRLKHEIEIIDCLEKRKARTPDHARDARLLSMGDLFTDEQGEEIPIAPFLAFRARCQVTPRPSRVRQVQTLEQGIELRVGEILAAVCDGDLTPIKTLILNRDADPYGRGAGVSALALLAAWAEISREPIVEYFLWLAEEGLEREPSQVWDSLVAESADIEALAVFPALRRAYGDGLADPQCMAPEELLEVELAPPGRVLEAMRARQPPIDDVAVATSWWSTFGKDSAHDPVEGEWNDDRPLAEPEEPYRAPTKVGRNERCPCGSGKKFKRCCGR